MKRRITKAGPSTLTVSLPARWARNHSLGAGDEMWLEEDGNKLILTKEPTSKEKHASISIADDSRGYVRSHIGRLYILGSTTIDVSFDDDKQFKMIREAVSNLLGADIVEFGKKNCRIRVFPTGELETDIIKNIVKMLNTLKYMLQLVAEDMVAGQFDRLETLKELRDNNWKAKDFMLRTLRAKGSSFEDTFLLSNMLFAYEKAGTNLLKFYREYFLADGKVRSSKEISVLLQKVERQISWLMEQLAAKEVPSPENQARFRKGLRRFQKDLLKDLGGKGADCPTLSLLYLLVELIDSSVSYLSMYKESGA